MNPIAPSIESTDFSCPYCGAHAAQTWFDLFARRVTLPRRRPLRPTDQDSLELQAGAPAETIEAAYKFVERIIAREIFLDDQGQNYHGPMLHNVNVSQCYNCNRFALWHYRNLMYPALRIGSTPNPDLNPDIQRDIEEARSILNLSPRGAAALLRLAIQKLCKQLGESGKNIDKDIQSLVDKGMDPHLQQAFDAVRVIGNDAVHPGALDLRDDHQTAGLLIDLINIVAQELITNKKSIADLYARLPADKLAGIAARAKGAAKKSG